MWSANSYYYKVVREGNFALSLFHFANLYFTLSLKVYKSLWNKRHLRNGRPVSFASTARDSLLRHTPALAVADSGDGAVGGKKSLDAALVQLGKGFLVIR